MLQKIKWFIQGNKRKTLMGTWLSFFIPRHIREQYKYRLQKANPVCLKNKKCIQCGCTMPAVLLADKGCKRRCYGKMMDKYTWFNYKKTNNIEI